MHALVLDNNTKRLEQGQIAFLQEGLQVTGSGSIAVAEIALDRFDVDILVIDRRTAGKRFAEIVRTAERRNPKLVSIALTPDVSGDTDRMVQAFPSMHCVLGDDLSPSVAAKLAMASVSESTGSGMAPREVEVPRVPQDSDIQLTRPGQYAPQPAAAPAPQPQWFDEVATPQPAPQPRPVQQPVQQSPQPARMIRAEDVQVARVVQGENGPQIVHEDEAQATARPVRSVAPVFSSTRRSRAKATQAA
ncbi:hypothetical protein [Tropicibacter naphthalenivorans]|uniref:Uncharacterized protein n=1 Tax=Tropicibacter naphthalenivorans TaxID=441103 RepID=A0A0P1G3V1_9RHOB|nr:hypothetical protein [Tropicibacter naphthalenivorans]CUH76483.1 hypothetical protein TRN7648_00959 [Tropicibacter naphthalenivorans]SMC65888.1 hypothetical protein SAMN04488093_102659 [Tropicibacter naphthalenivorans]